MGKRTDVLIVGGGPVGVCAALALARDGASVTLIEKGSEVCPPVSGAHANCGLIVPSDVTPLASPGALGTGLRWLLDGSSPFYISPRLSPSLLRWLWLYRASATRPRVRAAQPVLASLHAASSRLHHDLATEGGDRWRYRSRGVLMAYESAAYREAVMEASEASLAGVPGETVSPARVAEWFPALRAHVSGGIFHPADAHLDPLRFTRGVADLALAAGAEVRSGTEAIAVESFGNGAVGVITTRGDFAADQVVLAGGAWTPALVRGLGFRLPIEPAKGYSVDIDLPASFPDLPLYLGEARVVFTPLGETLRLGSTLELSGWDMTLRRERVAYLRSVAERVMGLPSDEPARQMWVGPRPLTPDGMPILGRTPGHERVILATGHCLIGLSLAPVTGQLVSELAGGRAPSFDLTLLSPERFT